MQRKKPWKVRVRREEEVWVAVEASTPAEAEILAAQLPKVLSVFGKSATPASRIYVPEPAAGVQEDELFPR